MNLYINGRFLTQKITGVQRYAIEVVKQLDKIITPEDKVIILHPKNIIHKLELKNIELKQIGKLKGHLWEQISLPLYLLGKKSVKLLNMCNIAPIFKPGYVVLHDISFKTHPEHLSKKFRLVYNIITKLNIKRYKHIFTVSEFSKKEIMNTYNVKNDKITVTYNSAEHIKSIKPDDKIIEKLELSNKDFVFSLGSNSPHKNRKFVIECAKNNPNVLFVITGQSSNVFNSESQVDTKNIIFTGYLSDEEVVKLYSTCKAFLFPSLYEGFGIPPLEALECGCKNIILSSLDVLHEVYGESASYIDVYKENNDIFKLIFNDSKNTKAIRKYTWEKSASIIIKKIKEEK